MTIRETSRAFISEAFDALRKEFVIPTPMFHPYVRVGRDYYGDTIRSIRAYHDLEAQLNERYPERFDEPLKRPGAEFASTYIFSFLNACIARCGRLAFGNARDHFDPNSKPVDESVDELFEVLGSSTYEVVCCRFVSHLTTDSAAELQLGDVRVVPESSSGLELISLIGREIADGRSAFNRDDPRPYDPPHALLIARERTSDPDPYEVVRRLSSALEQTLLLTRLFTGGTARSIFEVSGMTTLVSRMNASMVVFRGGRTLVRRTVWLDEGHQRAFEAVGGLIDQAAVKRRGMAATSFDVAIMKFNDSHRQGDPYEDLVDLATALEAILTGDEGESEGLTLRLRARASALLAVESDPAKAIFADVGHLYGLRSKLVHGGQIKETDLRRDLSKLSMMPKGEAESAFGVAIARAGDRMRDLVRRAILARLCLAAGPDAVWPFSGGIGVDAQLSDDDTRIAWRAKWHDEVAGLGADQAAQPAPKAVDFITPVTKERQGRQAPSAETQRPDGGEDQAAEP